MSKKRTLFFFVPMLAVTLLSGFFASLTPYFLDLELSVTFLLAVQYFIVFQGFTLTAFLTALLVFYRAPGEKHRIPPIALCVIAAVLCAAVFFLMGILGAVTFDASLVFGIAVLVETFIGSLLGYLLSNAMLASKKKKKRVFRL